MLSQDYLSDIIDSQRKYFVSKKTDLVRESLDIIPVKKGYATLITGLRRCGKCTLLIQLQKKENFTGVVYFNFEDIRLSGFEPSDFSRLGRALTARSDSLIAFFDEIHLMKGWETFVCDLLKDGWRIFITDTSARLPEVPFAVSMELFTFSYTEFLDFSRSASGPDSLTRYLKTGGIPKFVRNEGTSILGNLLDDILVRDIAVHHSLKDAGALRQLAVYLLQNTGLPVSANALTGRFGIKSCATVLEYFNFYQNAYLLELIPQFSHSSGVRQRNPKKIYAMDVGLINVASATEPNLESRLENTVYLYLRRKHHTIYYYSGNKCRCDFIAQDETGGNKTGGNETCCNEPYRVVQVCGTLHDENYRDEVEGLAAAAVELGLKRGTLVTFSQKEVISHGNIQIEVVPAYEYLK